MKIRHKLALGSVLCVFLFCFFASGCCLTNKLWQSVADEPQKFVGVSMTGDHVLHLAVRYEDGRTWHLQANLMPRVEWVRRTARRVGPLDGSLPPSAFEIGRFPGSEPPPNWINIDYQPTEDKQGGTDHDVWVDGADYSSIVTLPEPIDWSTAAPYLALVASLFTILIDFLTAPLWVLWIVFTAGGHGDCWLPWCN